MIFYYCILTPSGNKIAYKKNDNQDSMGCSWTLVGISQVNSVYQYNDYGEILENFFGLN